MKVKELNLEIEASNTLGGGGEGHVQGRGKWRGCTCDFCHGESWHILYIDTEEYLEIFRGKPKIGQTNDTT
jgi:hypothetical protein